MSIRTRLAGSVLVVVGAALLPVVPARASLIIAVQFVSANVGSTGNPIEVTLTNTGPSPVTVGGFAFQVTTTDADIIFTESDFYTTPAPYIFTADSSFGPFLNLLGLGQTMDGSDLSATGLGTSIGSGATVGLGRVLFNVSPTAASGPFAVSLEAFPTTNLSGPLPDFANIPINTLTPGQITLTGAATVPEPGTLETLGCGIAVLLAALKKRRKA